MRKIDPAELEGDALVRWYTRTPAELEEERRLQKQQVYDAFFGTAPNLDLGAVGVDPEFAERNLVWVDNGLNRWKAVPFDALSSASYASGGRQHPDNGWREARGEPPPAPPIVRTAPVRPVGGAIGTPMDGVEAPPGGGGFFGDYDPIRYPDANVYVTALPSPLNSVKVEVGGWFTLGDGRRVRSDEVNKPYLEQRARMSGVDEVGPQAHVHTVDRLKDGYIPKAEQIPVGQREIDPTCHPKGGWERDPQWDKYPQHTKRYEAQITRAPGLDYVIRDPVHGNVKFDGCAVWAPRHELLEAKGPGLESVMENALKSKSPIFHTRPFKRVTRQAESQSSLAGGHEIDWHVAEPGAQGLITNSLPVDSPIRVILTPAR